MDRPVAISKVKSALQHTDSIVIRLFAPAMVVRDRNKTRVSDVGENHVAEMGAPNAIKDLSIRSDRCGGHVIPTKSRFAVLKVGIEDVTAQSSTRRADHSSNKPIIGEPFFEAECAQLD